MGERIVVAGSRDFTDYELMCDFLGSLALTRNDVIISGRARGADRLGERYAKEHGLGVILKPADWDRYGKSAGYRRNEAMADIATRVVAFWDGKSRGTKHMIDIARKKGVTLNVVHY